MGGKLYIVATPIGNLADISIRAVETLRKVDLILAEDTRTSKTLLEHYSVSTPTRSFHAHNEHRMTELYLKMVQDGQQLAIISDAGMPGISDPGFLLVRAVTQQKLPLEVIPGPTAFLLALIKSGFPTDRFIYEGFLPHKKGRQTRLKEILKETRTVVLYESTHRILKLLQELQYLEEESRRISVSRELTKKFEETITGAPSMVLAYFSTHTCKGEFVVVIEGK